jgi:hypothetical protein
MDSHHLQLEMARRHVADAEKRVMRQTALVAELTRQGRDTGQAETMLVLFSDTLDAMRQHLAVEERTPDSCSWISLRRHRQ